MTDDRRKTYNPPVDTTQSPEDGGDDFTVGPAGDATPDASRTGGVGGTAGTSLNADTDMAGEGSSTDITDL